MHVRVMTNFVLFRMGRKRLHDERPSTNAERCKRYRAKQGDLGRADDSLRKWTERSKVKQEDPAKHKKRLALLAAQKRDQRQRKKVQEESMNESATSEMTAGPVGALENETTADIPSKAISAPVTEAATPEESAVNKTPI